MKTCTKCGETKPLDAFHASMGGAGGVRGDCKECVKKLSACDGRRAQWAANAAKYRAANKEACAASCKRSKAKNPAAGLECVRRARETVSDSYVRKLFRIEGQFVGQSVPPLLIELRRESILLHRLMKELRHVVTETEKPT